MKACGVKERNKSNDLTQGPFFKKILLVGLPLMLSNVLQVLFNMSDLAVVGKFGGEGALGAVGSTVTYVSLFTGIMIGLGSGVNALVARHLGAGNEEKVSRITHTAALVSLIAGLVLFALGAGVAEPVLKLLGTKPEFIKDSALYVYIYFTGLPALALYNFGNGVLSADGDTKRPLIFLSIAGVINVCLNLLFVIVIKMSVAGVALASSISQCISAVLILITLFRTNRPYKLIFKNLKISGKEAKAMLALGLPAGLQNAIFATANLFIQAGVNSFDSVMVEGNSAAANADALVYDVMAAFYMAGASFIAQNYGAGKDKNILKCYFISFTYAFAFGLMLGLFFLFFGKYFLAVFTSDSAIIEAGMKRLKIMAYSYCVSAFMDTTIAASRGMGKTLIPTIIVVMGSCVFRIIWVYTVFAHYNTITALYLVYVVSWAITALIEIGYFIIIYTKLVKRRRADTQSEN